MRHLRYVLAAVAVGALAAGPLAGAATAGLLAPSYTSSDPERGAMMDEPPAEVSVTFSEPLDPSSVMNVVDECGKEIDAGPATVQLTEMTVELGDDLPSGMYKVVYRAVGLAGATGTSASSFEFMVHHGDACKGSKGGHHPPGHGKGKHKHGNGNGNHNNGHGNHGNEGNEHGGHGGGGSDHSEHSGMSGMSGSTHSGHDMGSSTSHGGKHRNHTGHKKPAADTPGQPTTLAGGSGNLPVGADAEAVLIGLGLALAVGVLGGWLLRMSGTLTGA